MNISWRHSIHTQMTLALALIFTLLVGTLGYTLYALRLRQHDYIILNLTGQLRVLSQTMVDQAKQYNAQAPDDYEKYNRDLAIYWQGLKQQTKQYNAIIESLKTRQLSGATNHTSTVKHGKIYCTFDAFSRSQLGRSAMDWQRFQAGLNRKLGDDANAPKLTWAAEYIVDRGGNLVTSSEKLAQAFQTMMESKINEIKWFLMLAAGLGTLLLLGILAMLRREVLQPIKATLEGFNQVAQGDFSHPVPVNGNNEISQMGNAFNQLTNRLNAIFRLTNRINQSKELDEILKFVHEEFKHFVPLEWVGVLFSVPDGRRLKLERHYSDEKMSFNLGQAFKLPSQLAKNMGTPIHLRFNTSNMPAANTLEYVLTQNGLQSALILPMQNSNTEMAHAYMVFASKNTAYHPDHISFLSNISAVISHAFEKTVVMENLVVAAIKGLAKLAESRDPETGDHLTRMALYSAIVAEELSQHPTYSTVITPAYVRDLFNFAPMHDIGKVGIADSILLKPGKLDADERKEMERHPTIGAEVLQLAELQVAAHGRSLFKIGIEIAAAHHEKFDGTGYPAGLKGDKIPLSARIVAAADVFDALTSKRPYKEAWSVQKALDFMQDGAGQHFDPEVVNALNRALPRILEVYERLKHI